MYLEVVVVVYDNYVVSRPRVPIMQESSWELAVVQ